MAVVRKRQDDTNLKVLRELVTSGGGNRQCFDCGQKGPTYVNMTIGSFVCTRCSGVLRGLTPPHRVKSISVATFTPDELEFLKAHGNDVCAKTWLGLWDPKRIVHQDQRELMIDKYERKRYYLEPASPLKSLTNATKVSSLSSSNNSISTSGSGSNIINNNNHTNGNNNNNSNGNNIHNNSSNISNKSSTENNLKSIALTPPTSLRITANGINSSSNSSRSQNRYNFNKNDDNSNHKSSPLVNGIGNSSSSSVASKNSLNISVSSGSSNGGQGFTPDSEFVADFSTANIFTAGSQNNLNGFKNHQQVGGLPNGQLQAGNFLNGGASTNHIGLANMSNANENFADFDHAPIFNAAAYQNSCNNNFNNMFASTNFYSPNVSNASTNAFNSAVQSCSNNSYISPISSSYSYNTASNGSVADSAGSAIYITSSSNNNNNNSNVAAGNISASLGNLQWNVWQQFQWPSFSTSSNIEPNTIPNPNQNRWSLPIPNSANNSFNSSSATINSNSTPPADRYAALKDLDEQIRESKAAAADIYSVQAQPSQANPFKTNPPAQPQQQPMNPFQTSYNQSSANLFGTQAQNSSASAFGTNAAFNVQPISNFNGYTAQPNANGSNGCSFGFGVQQPITAGNALSGIKNPFATSSLNPNNPFL